MMEQREGSAM
jgi:hypothetical protein